MNNKICHKSLIIMMIHITSMTSNLMNNKLIIKISNTITQRMNFKLNEKNLKKYPSHNYHFSKLYPSLITLQTRCKKINFLPMITISIDIIIKLIYLKDHNSFVKKYFNLYPINNLKLYTRQTIKKSLQIKIL